MYVHDFIQPVGPMVSFLVWRRIERKTTHAVNFDLLHRIYNFNGVWVLIFLSLSCNLVLWCELNKNSQSFLFIFVFQYWAIKRKATWQSWIWWLAVDQGWRFFFLNQQNQDSFDLNQIFFLFKSIFNFVFLSNHPTPLEVNQINSAQCLRVANSN